VSRLSLHFLRLLLRLFGTCMNPLTISDSDWSLDETTLPLLPQMRMTNDMGFAPTVGFSADGVTLFFAPCWDPSRSELQGTG
jgi:hypothetical protein